MKCDGRKAFVGVDGIATLVSVLSGKVNFQVIDFLTKEKNLKIYRKSNNNL
jgi:hypothetical protein